jgi:glutamate dehydrogenase
VAELSKAIASLMEKRDRAQLQTALPDVPKLRDVIEAVRSKVAPGERLLIESFARQLFDKAGADWLATSPVPELAGLVLAGYHFVAERSLDEPRVLVFAPDLIDAGWENPCTVVETVMRDRPFIVHSIHECLHQAGCTVQRLLHPVLGVERDSRGAVQSIGSPTGLGRKESFVHVEVDRVADMEALSNLLHQHLGDVVLATDDYQAMRTKAEEAAAQLRARPLPRPWNADVDEIAAFLEWLGQKNLVFLGYREYQFVGQGAERTAAVRRGSGLGILRKEDRSTFVAPRPIPEALRRRLHEPPLLIVSKTNAESPIHRRAHMDYIGIKEIDPNGVVVGERRFLGLFTSKAYAEEPTAVPLLRRKLAAILEAEGAVEESHDYKAITKLFNSIPKVELLAGSVPELHAEIKMILAAEASSDVKVLHRADTLGRGIFIMVILPRERFSDELARSIEVRLAHALAATAVLEQRLAIDEGDQVRLHLYLAAPAGNLAAISAAELRAYVMALLRTWDDRLRETLREQFPRERARELAERYVSVFSNAYKAATDVPQAVRDIRCLETLLETGTAQVDLSNPSEAGDSGRFTALKVYLAGEELVLSDFLPVLENLGLRVFAEDPLDVALPVLGRVRIHTFFVQDAEGARLDLEPVAPFLQPALLTVHAGRVSNDRLNALIVGAALTWRQVDLLRTYVHHGVQIGTAASRDALVQALVSWPQSARVLWEYFAAKFDPLHMAASRERLLKTLPDIERRFVASLDDVQSVADDRILRALFSAIAATVRTNYFSAHVESESDWSAERAALAVKIESAGIPHLPRPQPLYEIYVHATQVEATHLRGAKVARGGIRLSDRPDDFRTEILDLMKTQMVKNAVIVPAGAKGGFTVRRRGSAAASPAQVAAAYRTFIGALLDLTDNIVRGRVTPPNALVVYDDADPYLVVAADKGTATFSDAANEIAAQREFWLGDAFASGGAHGYDHKKEGITARGAWECVRRHFREMGRDADRDDLTVIGVGDMSGDVFGNGLLLSRRIRLRAAFNHQHIFLDPDPDPARSFAERERLFELPRSSWSDYSPNVISAGGGVFARTAKTIALAPPVRAMLGLETETATGEEVIRAVLRMDADLLWNGGIGTYVKAGDETHVEVGDSSNDPVRIDAAELRVKVVAEGGNLGITQRGRVEYALRSGRINTDAIDNSAGVDMSDHEVNLKIALAGSVESGQLPPVERNQLLRELTPDVTRRVLGHTIRQARALSLDQLRSQTRLKEFRELTTQLESDGRLDRQLERLPDRDSLRNRRGAMLGLTRPELAVLLAHSKLALQHRLLASAVPDDPFLEVYLRAYFPDVINARFGQWVRTHRLRREIIAVEVANALIDNMGMAFTHRVGRDTGADPPAVVRAWTVAIAVSGAAELWVELGTADPPLPAGAEARGWLVLESAIEGATKWVLQTQPADRPAADMASALGPAIQELLGRLPSILPANAQTSFGAAVERLAADGTPRALAHPIVTLQHLTELFEIGHISNDLGTSRGNTAEAYYGAGGLIDIEWIRQCLSELPADDRWERRAAEGLSEGLMYARRQLTHEVLASVDGGANVDVCLREYAAAHSPQLSALRAIIDDIKSARRASLPSLLVVMHELGRLVGRET